MPVEVDMRLEESRHPHGPPSWPVLHCRHRKGFVRVAQKEQERQVRLTHQDHQVEQMVAMDFETMAEEWDCDVRMVVVVSALQMQPVELHLRPVEVVPLTRRHCE